MSAKPPKKIDFIRAAIKKWLKPLGLLWWHINIHFYDDPNEVLRIFGDRGENRACFAITTVDWQYGTATIEFNLLAAEGMQPDHIEEAVVHELCHILVNEMREGEIHHEERVVTSLQRAFFWVLEDRNLR